MAFDPDVLKAELRPEQFTQNGGLGQLNAVEYQRLLQQVPPKYRSRLKQKGSPDRSKHIYNLVRELMEEGTSNDVIHAVMVPSPVVQDKYSGRNVSAEVWRDIENAARNGAMPNSGRAPKAEAIVVDEEVESWAGPEVRTVYDALRDPVPPPTWMVSDILVERGFGVLAGRFKLGKSLMAMDLGQSIATGCKFLNYFACRTAPVLLVQSEMDPGDMDMRARYIAESKDLLPVGKWKDDDTLLFRGSGIEKFKYVTNRAFKFTSEQQVEWLCGLIEDQEPELVIFDSLYRMMLGDLSSSTDVSGVIEAVDWIREEYDVAVLIVHNNRKSGTDPRKKVDSPVEMMFGSTMLANAFDDGMFLDGKQGEPVYVHREGRRPAPDFRVELFDEDYYSPRVFPKDPTVVDDKPQEGEKKKKSHHRAKARSDRQNDMVTFVAAHPGEYTASELANKFGYSRNRVQTIARERGLPLKKGQRGRPKNPST